MAFLTNSFYYDSELNDKYSFNFSPQSQDINDMFILAGKLLLCDTTGLGSDRVYSAALCRGDIPRDGCRACLDDSIVRLRQVCLNEKEAIGYYEYCWLRYSSESILGNTQINNSMYLHSMQNSTDIDAFNDALGILMNNLIGYAATGSSQLKFATGNTTGRGFLIIYGLVQCTPEITELQCRNCFDELNKRFPDFFIGKVGGRILLPTWKKNNTTRIVVITVVVIAIAILIIASLYIFTRLRKKNTPPPPPESIESKF
ncbi:hypothetical protein L1987_86708 [Smallanthus sonchifolius]|uniref:Uncharacterized protein n=1 Tax=Smallanthus sonchifolius TaxID=185202 RepID=A0ACB8Y0X4_9ASTR|nr:hypothetical protein L1987_86708 [Smallanthus sonchifolius]